MRTLEEVEEQIKGLYHLKEILPQISGFGDDNWGQIDAQLDILQGYIELDEMEEGDWDNLDEVNTLFRAAEEAKDWLDGEVDSLIE